MQRPAHLLNGITGLIAVTLLLASVDAGSSSQAQALLVELGDHEAVAASLGTAALETPAQHERRARLIRVDSAVLEGARVGQALTFAAFSDVELTLVATDVRWKTRRWLVWRGAVAGDPGATVSLSMVKGVAVGRVTTRDTTYMLGYVGDGVSRIAEVNTAQLPPEAEPIRVDVTGGPAVSGRDGMAAVTLGVMWTKKAKKAAGGSAAIKAEAGVIEADTQTALDNSMVDIQVDLVLARKIKGKANGGSLSADLNASRDGTDGKFDQAQTERANSQADYMMLLVHKNLTNICGRGYLMDGVSTAFSPFAYSVAFRQCIGGLTPPHEIGHNWGLCHDKPSSPTCQGSFKFAKGHVNAAVTQATIMAICNSCFGCPRLPYYSNKKKKVNGDKIGDRRAQAAKALNKAKDTLAAMF